MIHDKTNLELLEELNKEVVGHEDAKKHLINLINRSKARAYLKNSGQVAEDKLLPPGKLLLIGESGTGKTYLVQRLQKVLQFPLCFLDATKFIPTGAAGGIKSQDVSKLARLAAENNIKTFPGKFHDVREALDNTVIFIDEIDKLAENWDSSGAWNKHVQSNFLTILEHSSTDTDLSGATFIFAGAFTGLKDHREAHNSVGFTSGGNNGAGGSPKNIDDEDIVQYGLIPELVGRVSAIVELDKFLENDYYNILVDKILPDKRRELEQLGIYGALISEPEIQKIVQKAAKSGQGVRALKRGLEKHFLELEFNYEQYMLDTCPRMLPDNRSQQDKDADLLQDAMDQMHYEDDTD